MSIIRPSYQEFFDLPDGSTVGVTRFKLVENNNSVIIAPPVRNNTLGDSFGVQLLDVNDAAITSDFYLSADGTVLFNNISAANLNKDVTFISLHPTRNGTP